MRLIQKIKCKLRKHNWNTPYVLQEFDRFLEVYQECLCCPRARHFRIAKYREDTKKESIFCKAWMWEPLYDDDPLMQQFLNSFRERGLI